VRLIIKTVADLPAAPPGRVGWPWTAGEQPRPSAGPRVTVVTPSFNQAAYLEATIRSVLLQGYPGLEYFVIDGGSTDGSREILARYAPYLDYCISEPDRGQAHAINKGLARATGEVIAWLNSDDYYAPGALARMASEFESDDALEWIYGDCLRLSSPGGALAPCPSEPFRFPAALRGYSPICQPGAFVRRSLLDKTGGLDETFRLAMDYDLWLRAIKHARPLHLAGTPLAVVTEHPAAKSRYQHGEFVFESTRVIERFYAGPDVPAEAVPLRDAVLGHLYLECAAAAVLWRKSLAQAVPWFLRGLARDPRLLARVPRVLSDLAGFVVRDRGLVGGSSRG
jgi:GT2 family glycosyltransferase